jgi:hypothetical protein
MFSWGLVSVLFAALSVVVGVDDWSVVVGVDDWSVVVGAVSFATGGLLLPACSPAPPTGGEVIVAFPRSVANVETGMNAYDARAIPTIKTESVSIMLFLFLLDINMRADYLL